MTVVKAPDQHPATRILTDAIERLFKIDKGDPQTWDVFTAQIRNEFLVLGESRYDEMLMSCVFSWGMVAERHRAGNLIDEDKRAILN